MTKAIFTGINLYSAYPEDTLRGCVNDSQNLRYWAFNRLGYRQSEILTLHDSRAKAVAEKEAILNMVIGAGPQDHVIWSHSSHGSNNPDPSQRDGLQELLCSYDILEKDGIWDLDTVISAKWIGETIARLHPEATLDIILDCCKAPEGSQLKEMGRRYERAKWLPRSVVTVPVKPKTIQAVQSTIPKNVALWSACEPHQTSADAHIDNQWQGAFTAAFLKAFKEKRSRSDIIFLAKKWLKDNHYSQVPHLYCWPQMAQMQFKMMVS